MIIFRLESVCWLAYEASNWLAAKTHYGSCWLPKVQHHLFKKYPTFDCSPPPPTPPLPQTPEKKIISSVLSFNPDIIRSAVHKVLTVCTHWSNAGHVLARLVKFPTLNLQRSDLERKIRIYKRMKSATALDQKITFVYTIEQNCLHGQIQ